MSVVNEKGALGQAVKRIRVIRGMSRPELAKAAGVSADAVALLEQGKHSAPEDLLAALAKGLRLPRGCLIILTRRGGRTKAMTDFVHSLQKLITALVEAQETGMAGIAAPQRAKPRRKAM